jgi:xanthine dehydrogenase accessory factor
VASNTPAVLAMRVDNETPEHRVITASTGQPQAMPDEVWREVRCMLNTLSTPASENLAPENPMISLKSEKAEWWLESICDQRPELYLFGAGHVGQEVARLLQRLPFRLTWVDQRSDIFPVDAAEHGTLNAADPLAAVAQAGPNSIFVVMTHSHQLDEEICHAIFQRLDSSWDFRWLGLIGSDTKRKRFVHRLKQRGIAELQLRRLVCPIGLAGLHGKQPATIALSLLAQLMMEPIEKEY